MSITHVLDRTLLVEQELLVVPTSFATLPLPILLLACQDQTERFRRGADNDPRFCLELFRRALEEQDSEAWQGLVDLYGPLLLARLRKRDIAPDLAEEAVQQMFFTLLCKSRDGAVSTRDHTLAQLLHYLWSGVRFALITLRRQQQGVSLPEDSDRRPEFASIGDETIIERALDAQVLLRRVRKLVTHEEWEILRLRFDQGLPPREIATQMDMAVEDVYLTLASAKRRIRSDPQLRAFMDGDNAS